MPAGVTGESGAGRGSAHHTAKAGTTTGQKGGRYAHRGDGAPIDPRYAQLEGDIVDEEAGLEVVQPVEDDPRAFYEFLGVGMVEVCHDTLHLHLRIGLPPVLLRRHRLRQVLFDVGFGEQQLPLQVVVFDEVPVDDPNPAHSRAHERAGDNRPQGSAADHDRVAVAQPLLSLRANPWEDGLPGVPVKLFHSREILTSKRSLRCCRIRRAAAHCCAMASLSHAPACDSRASI